MAGFIQFHYGRPSKVEASERGIKSREAQKRLEEKVKISLFYNRKLQDEYIQLYVDSCSFDDEYNIIDDISLDMTKPDDYEHNYFQAIKRAKLVSGYAFQEGIVASMRGPYDLPDKYKTLDEITAEIYDRYNSNGMAIDEVAQNEIRKEINRRYDKNSTFVYRKFFDAGYMHNEIMRKLSQDNGHKTK